MSIEWVMQSNCLIICSPTPSFPVLNLSQHQGLFQELALHIRWSKYWSFSFSISLSNEYSELISFIIDWFDLLAVQGTLKLKSLSCTPLTVQMGRRGCGEAWPPSQSRCEAASSPRESLPSKWCSNQHVRGVLNWLWEMLGSDILEASVGLPWWLSGKESICQRRSHRIHPWVGKIPWRRK